MIIDKEQLISLLKEKTDLEREKVEGQLTQLVKRIQQAAEKNKTFEIEGFGTFSVQDDNLQFEPTDTLETEINNKYAGMKPIELIGAFKEPEGDEVPDIDENIEGVNDKAWAFDKESLSEDESEEINEPVAKTTSDDEEQKEEIAEELAAEADDEKQEADISEDESKKVLEDMVKSMEDQLIGPEVPVDDTRSKPEENRSDKEDHPDKESDLIGTMLIAAVVVIAVGLSGWMAYDTGLIGGSDGADNYSQAGPSVAQQDEQPQMADEQGGSSQDSEANISSEPEQEMSVVRQEDPPPEEETDEEAGFGLKGKLNENISSGYTIVVHSLRKLDEAESRKENLQEAGYRALISKADVQGTTYFRVGLGQFETVENALQAVSDIPESFQNNQGHFIKRIQ